MSTLGLNQQIHHYYYPPVILVTAWITHKCISCKIFTTAAPQAKWVKLVHSESTRATNAALRDRDTEKGERRGKSLWGNDPLILV